MKMFSTSDAILSIIAADQSLEEVKDILSQFRNADGVKWASILRKELTNPRDTVDRYLILRFENWDAPIEPIHWEGIDKSDPLAQDQAQREANFSWMEEKEKQLDAALDYCGWYVANMANDVAREVDSQGHNFQASQNVYITTTGFQLFLDSLKQDGLISRETTLHQIQALFRPKDIVDPIIWTSTIGHLVMLINSLVTKHNLLTTESPNKWLPTQQYFKKFNKGKLESISIDSLMHPSIRNRELVSQTIETLVRPLMIQTR